MSGMFAGGMGGTSPPFGDDGDLASPLLLSPRKGDDGEASSSPPSPRPSTAETAASSSSTTTPATFGPSPPLPPSAAGGTYLPFDPDYYHDYDEYETSGGLDDNIEATNDGRCFFRCYCKISPRCPPFVKSLLAIILAMTCIASIAFVCLDSVHDDLASGDDDSDRNRNVAVWSMVTTSLLISSVVIWNEIVFLRGNRATAATRRALGILNLRRRSLLDKNMRLARKVDVLEPKAGRYETAMARLRDIAESQSFDVDDVIRMVNENEKTVELIREKIRLEVSMDVVGIIIANDNNREGHGDGSSPRVMMNAVRANRLIDEVKAKIATRHGVILEENNFMHALASDSTTWGAFRTVKNLLPDPPPSAEEDEVRNGLSGGIVGGEVVDDFDNDDVYDAFFLLCNDRRQAGSVDVVRAVLAGKTHTSLSPKTTRWRRSRRGASSGGHRLSAPAIDDDADDDGGRRSSCSPEKASGGSSTLRGQLGQFWNMFFPYFRESAGGRVLFGFMFVLCLCNSAISVYFSYLFRDFYTALADKEVHKFYSVLFRFLVSLIVLIPLQARRARAPSCSCHAYSQMRFVSI
jgi:hypothetical protein